jgi:hypothetical protein
VGTRLYQIENKFGPTGSGFFFENLNRPEQNNERYKGTDNAQMKIIYAKETNSKH